MTDRPTGTFLTRDELNELTGAKLRKKQIAWLQRRGWEYELNCLGWPVVLRAMVEGKMGASDSESRWELDAADVA
jgi:hypothetical protein